MKKEAVFLITLIMLGFSYMLDYFAGSLNLTQIKNPLVFLDLKYFNLYPMTFVSVSIRSIAIAILVVLLLSAIERQYIKKALITLFIIFVAEIYSFQQLATGAKMTPTLWTLAISYAGMWLVLAIVFYIFSAIGNFLIPSQRGSSLSKEESVNDTKIEESVLNP